MTARLEKMAERVHEARMEDLARQGFHAPANCEWAPESPRARVHCDWCHEEITHYSKLPESAKGHRRAAVRSTLQSLADIGLRLTRDEAVLIERDLENEV